VDLSFDNLLRIIILFLAVHTIQAQPEVGVVANLSQQNILNKAGYTFLVEGVPQLVSPRSVSDSAFQYKRSQLGKLTIPVYALNIFIPGDLKLVGPDVDEQEILKYTQKVFERSREAGINLIIWGSGSARKIPDGYAKELAQKQFIDLARKVARQANQFGVILALENLNSTETNFITTVAEALKIVKAVNQPNFWLCADIYHMLKEKEPAAVLLNTRGYLVHCDIAEQEDRTPPGTRGDDFREYFQALKQINYSGKLVVECRWNNMTAQAAAARISLQQQLNEVWK